MSTLALLLILFGVKVGGVEFAPKDLIFAAAEPRSRATADGELGDQCKWTFLAETRVAKREDDHACVHYYYKTYVELVQSCPSPNEKTVVRSAERITSPGGLQCPDASGKIASPQLEAKVLSTGTTADGKHQDIVAQPDGTRITLLYDGASVTCSIGFPDGSADFLKQP